jgi:hypothetical protein
VALAALGNESCHQASAQSTKDPTASVGIDGISVEELIVVPITEVGETLRLDIPRGAVEATPGKPNMVAYVPRGFDRGQVVHIVVYFHGWWNCAEHVLEPQNSGCGDGPMRHAYNLAAQFEASGKNAILLVPETSYDQPASVAGRLTEPGAFADMIEDTLAAMAPKIGKTKLSDVGKIIVAAHSGGYAAAAEILSHGGLWVDEVWLFDALYDANGQFESWVRDDTNQAGFAQSPPTRRFAVIYTADTVEETDKLVDKLSGRFDEHALWLDRGLRRLAGDDYQRGIIFKLSQMTHDDVPRHYFSRLLASSSLPDRQLAR